jgi:hypothetical protein
MFSVVVLVRKSTVTVWALSAGESVTVKLRLTVPAPSPSITLTFPMDKLDANGREYTA